MNNLEEAANLFGLIYEGQEDKIVANNVKNARIVVRELVDTINKAKAANSKGEKERFLEEGIKKCNLIVSNLSAALEYSKEHSGSGF